MIRKSAFSIITAFLVSTNLPGSPTPATAAADALVDQLITWIFENETDQRVIKQISTACDETIKRFNTPDGAIQSVSRINLRVQQAVRVSRPYLTPRRLQVYE